MTVLNTALARVRERWYYAAWFAAFLVIGLWYGVYGGTFAQIAFRSLVLPASAIYGVEMKRHRERAAREGKAKPRGYGLLFVVSFAAFSVMWLALSLLGVL